MTGQVFPRRGRRVHRMVAPNATPSSAELLYGLRRRAHGRWRLLLGTRGRARTVPRGATEWVSERLRTAGLATGIVTREGSSIVRRRAEKLAVDELHVGVTDKLATITAIVERRGLTLAEVAYIGDDLPDLDVLSAVGFAGCPADGEAHVRGRVHYVCTQPGGRWSVPRVRGAGPGGAAGRVGGPPRAPARSVLDPERRLGGGRRPRASAMAKRRHSSSPRSASITTARSKSRKNC